MSQPWIFFDFDGTAVDTIPMLKRAFFKFGKELGIRFTDQDFERSNGPKTREIMRDVRRRFSLKRYSVGELISLHEKYEQKCYKIAKPRPDLRNMAKIMQRSGWKCALVTSAPRSIVRDFFKKYRWNEIFEFAVTGDDVERAKPHPDLYLLAQKRAGGTGPFLAIEDSSSGIQSATRAGCIAVRFDTKSRGKFLGISSFRELCRRLHIIDSNAFLVGDRDISFTVNHQIPNSALFFPSDDQKKMAQIWRRAKKKKNLFDGLIFTAGEEINPFYFLGGFVRYRHIYPQLLLRQTAFPVRVAVSVVARVGDLVFISQRSQRVTESPGKWEFAPSGAVGVEARVRGGRFLDLKRQVSAELREEFGVSPDQAHITHGPVFFDLNQRIMEVLFEATLPQKLHFRAGAEHMRHVAVSRTHLKKMLAKDQDQFTPITKIIARQWLNI